MRVLVTGGAGFIGSHIADALLARGHGVAVYDNLNTGRRENVPADTLFMNYDLTRPVPLSIFDVVELYEPDAICHQAAQPSLRRSIDEPAYDAQVNIIGTINVIQAARSVGAHVVFASTSAVYDPQGGTFTEDSPICPNLPYGIAKAAAEMYLRNSGVSHTILRYGNVYGPRQVAVGENQLIPHALAHIFDGADFAINGDGEQTRDWVYVEDIARANVLALEGKVQGTFNLGWGEGRSVNEVCTLLSQAVGIDLDWPHGPAKVGEARHVALNSLMAFAELDWTPDVTLEDGLARTAEVWLAERVPA